MPLYAINDLDIGKTKRLNEVLIIGKLKLKLIGYKL